MFAMFAVWQSEPMPTWYLQAEVNELDMQLHSELRSSGALVAAKDEAHAARQAAEARAAQLEQRATEAQADAAAAREQRCGITRTQEPALPGERTQQEHGHGPAWA